MRERGDAAGEPRWREHLVSESEAGSTVQQVLTGAMGVSRRMLQRLTRAKGLRHNRRPAWLAARVRAGDVVAARLGAESGPGLEPVEMPLEIVHEDADVLAVDKPPFLLVHPTSPAHDRTLAHGVAWHLREAGGAVRPVHRIDRDTSGLVLFAKSSHAHHRLDLALREGRIDRAYLALVDGVVAEDAGTIDAPIARDPRNAALRVVRETGDRAVTHFTVRERHPASTLLRLVLDTGRTHQIRVHLQHLGHPVIGDRQYGRRRVDAIGRQALHAAELAFPHPSTDERITLSAPLPSDIREAIDRLR